MKEIFLPIRQLKDEFAELYKQLETLNSPIVFCHNDLLLGNVVYEKSTDRITFIDYEYAGQNFQAFDIGNHFTEFAGEYELISLNRLKPRLAYIPVRFQQALTSSTIVTIQRKNFNWNGCDAT